MFEISPPSPNAKYISANNQSTRNNMNRSALAAQFGEDTINILTRDDGSIDEAHIKELFRVEGVPPTDFLSSKRGGGSIADELIKYSQDVSSELNMFKDHLTNNSGVTPNSGFSLDLFG